MTLRSARKIDWRMITGRMLIAIAIISTATSERLDHGTAGPLLTLAAVAAAFSIALDISDIISKYFSSKG